MRSIPQEILIKRYRNGFKMSKIKGEGFTLPLFEWVVRKED